MLVYQRISHPGNLEWYLGAVCCGALLNAFSTFSGFFSANSFDPKNTTQIEAHIQPGYCLEDLICHHLKIKRFGSILHSSPFLIMIRLLQFKFKFRCNVCLNRTKSNHWWNITLHTVYHCTFIFFKSPEGIPIENPRPSNCWNFKVCSSNFSVLPCLGITSGIPRIESSKMGIQLAAKWWSGTMTNTLQNSLRESSSTWLSGVCPFFDEVFQWKTTIHLVRWVACSDGLAQISCLNTMNNWETQERTHDDILGISRDISYTMICHCVPKIEYAKYPHIVILWQCLLASEFRDILFSNETLYGVSIDAGTLIAGWFLLGKIPI